MPNFLCDTYLYYSRCCDSTFSEPDQTEPIELHCFCSVGIKPAQPTLLLCGNQDASRPRQWSLTGTNRTKVHSLLPPSPPVKISYLTPASLACEQRINRARKRTLRWSRRADPFRRFNSRLVTVPHGDAQPCPSQHRNVIFSVAKR